MNLSPDTTAMITGASGAFGWVLARRLSGACNVVGTCFSRRRVPRGVTPVGMDLGDEASVVGVLEAHRPDVVVHAAAMTNPDDCERDPAYARKVNLQGSAVLAEHAGRLGSRMIYISTDLVFDGKRGDYGEHDEASPLGVYGRTKLEAERAFLEGPCSARGARPAVLRSSLIYGWGSPVSGTFLSNMYSTLKAGRRMRLFTDQMRNPVLEDDLAGAVLLAIEGDLEGLYHAGGPRPASRFDFGRTVCEAFGLDGNLLEPISMGEFEYAADRPLDSTLNISKLSACGFSPRSPEDALALLAASLPD